MNFLNYKIWLVVFIILTIVLSAWTLNLLTFINTNITNSNNIEIISPSKEFKKELPPEDNSIPYEDRSLWNAFKTQNLDDIGSQEIIGNKKEIIDDVVKSDDTYIEKSKPLNKDQVKKSLDNNEVLFPEDNKKKKYSNNNLDQKKQTAAVKPKVEEKKKLDAVEENIKPSNKKEGEAKTEKNNAFYLQIASLPKEELVIKEWARLKRKFSNELDDFKYKTEKVLLNEKGTFYRIFLGEFSSKLEANRFCKEIMILKNCIIKIIQ
mgnify:CR=1 FL=1